MIFKNNIRSFWIWLRSRNKRVIVQVDGKPIGFVDRSVAEVLTNDRNNFDLVVVPGKLINLVHEEMEKWIELDVPLLDKRYRLMVHQFQKDGLPEYRLHSSAGVSISPIFHHPNDLAKWCQDVFTDTYGFDISEALSKCGMNLTELRNH